MKSGIDLIRTQDKIDNIYCNEEDERAVDQFRDQQHGEHAGRIAKKRTRKNPESQEEQ